MNHYDGYFLKKRKSIATFKKTVYVAQKSYYKQKQKNRKK